TGWADGLAAATAKERNARTPAAALAELSQKTDVVGIPGGTEHEACFREDTEVIDFFAPRRDDFLLGMPTAGHHGVLDALRGSTTERVIRQAPCPVFALSAASPRSG